MKTRSDPSEAASRHERYQRQLERIELRYEQLEQGLDLLEAQLDANCDFGVDRPQAGHPNKPR